MGHLFGKRGGGLTLIALAATCSLPAAAQAAELPPLQPAGAAAQLQQAATPALASTSTAQGAVQQTADQVVAPAQPAVEQVAGKATKTVAAQTPPLDTAVRIVETTVAPARPAAPGRPAAPAPANTGDGVRALRGPPSGPTGQKAALKRRDSSGTTGDPQRGPLASAERVTVSKPAAGSTTATPAPASVDGGTSATRDLSAGAGSTASASSTSFSIGALALLAAALMLAGPAIARRLRVDRASFRPPLFVSVLERPG